MEPLGIVASVIAVLQASDRALNYLSSFRRARFALQELEELRNSIVAVRLVFAESPAGICPATENECCRFCALVRGCDRILMSMEELLLENRVHAGKIKRVLSAQVLRARWSKRQPRIDSLKLQLRDSITLLTLHTTLNSATCTGQRNRGIETAKTDGKASSVIVGSQLNMPNQPRNAAASVAVRLQSNSIRGMNYGKGRSGTLCTPVCRCACHRQLQWHVPICQGRLGFLLVKSTGLLLGRPVTNSECASKSVCLRHETARATVLYISPRWLPYFGLCLTFSNPGRPQFGLSFLRIQTPDSEFCMSIRTGNCVRVCQLLASGQGHIADMICPYGISVLQLAFQSGQRDVCRLLIGQGAQEDPAHTRWSHNDLWDYMVQWASIQCSMPFSDVYKDYMNFMSPCAEADDLVMEDEFVVPLAHSFSRFHKSIVGLSSECLEGLCEKARDEIDEIDSSGRTPLIWAVRRKSLAAVQTLLNFGADPNIADKHGRSPVHIAAGCDAGDCLRALAYAGADLEARDRLGVSPLVYAALRDRPGSLELLIDLGADVNLPNELGETALSYANMAGNIGTATVLISRGACVDNVDAWGYIPILDAVLTNFHEGLRTYCVGPASMVATSLKDGQTILHLAARNADMESMNILLGADLSALDPESRDASGKTAMDYFLCRNHSDDLTLGFLALMAKAGRVSSETISQ